MPDLPPNNSARYTFAHFLLPVLVLMNPKKFHEDISGRGAEDYLRHMWLGMGKRMGVRTFEHKFLVNKASWGDGEEVYLIYQPHPTEMTDAFFSAAYFKLHKGFFSKTIEAKRYFTLELSYGGTWQFCEWEGNRMNGGRHLNYGELPDTMASTFLSAIQAKTA